MAATDSMGSSALHWACFCGSLATCALLLALKCPIQIQDGQGITALHLAVESAPEKLGSARLVTWLVKSGADPFTLRDLQGRTALDVCKQLRDSSVKRAILKAFDENKPSTTYSGGYIDLDLR